MGWVGVGSVDVLLVIELTSVQSIQVLLQQNTIYVMFACLNIQWPLACCETVAHGDLC